VSIVIGPRPIAPPATTRFAVVCHARTGSNFLCGALDSHPSVLCHHEVFHRDGIHYSLSHRDRFAHVGTAAERDADPQSFLDRLLADDRGHAAVGFKVMRGQNPDIVEAVLRDRAIRKLVLRRENRVRVFVSKLRALKADVFAHVGYDGVAVRVDPAELLAFVDDYDRFYAGVDAALGRQPALRLSYERLAEPGTLAQALTFIGVEPDEGLLRPRHERQSSDTLRDAIENYDELEAALRGTALHADLVAEEAAAPERRPAVVAARSRQVVAPPDFVGVGAQKSGTSWWYSLVARHPGVHDPTAFDKEARILSYPEWDGSSPIDPDLYESLFERPAGMLAGEWTPDYLWHPFGAPKLRELAPDAKILFLVRDPIERFRSGIAHHLMYDEPIVRRTFRKTYMAGLYGLQLRRLLRSFPREQVLVLQYERCIAAPGEELRRTYRFLGLDDSFQPTELDRPVHPSTVERPELPPRFRARLVRGYRRDASRLIELAPELDIRLWKSLHGGFA
jgi:LPS sulfotransferase NodH